MSTQISAEVRDVLNASQICSDRIILAGNKMEWRLYVAVNEAITRLGGKWNRKAGAHLFDHDPRPLLAEVLRCGALPDKNPDAFFETPPSVLDSIFARIGWPSVELPRTFKMLEPSAGNGAIANRLREEANHHIPGVKLMHTVEIDPGRCRRLIEQGHYPHEGDFLTVSGLEPEYDLIVMNPPFTAPGRPNAGLDHTLHAYSLLATGGTLASVLPSGWKHRQDKRHSAFRDLVSRVGDWIDNPKASFRQAGTDVDTTVVFLAKGETP